MEKYVCPHCGRDLSQGLIPLVPTTLFYEEYRYTMCKECENFLIVNLKNFEIMELPEIAQYDAIKEFDKIICKEDKKYAH